MQTQPTSPHRPTPAPHQPSFPPPQSAPPTHSLTHHPEPTRPPVGTPCHARSVYGPCYHPQYNLVCCSLYPSMPRNACLPRTVRHCGSIAEALLAGLFQGAVAVAAMGAAFYTWPTPLMPTRRQCLAATGAPGLSPQSTTLSPKMGHLTKTEVGMSQEGSISQKGNSKTIITKGTNHRKG